MAIPFIKHSFVGKSTQAQAYTAAAHVRYISREKATVYRYAERMPLHYHAAQRFLNEREDSIRKNGRIIDKLVISIPREMTMDQAVDTIRSFGFQLSDGRAPFYFTIQDWGKNNPHAHFIYVDADISTGKRVFRTTDRDSSDRIKALWENVCNKELHALGIDASISFQEAAEKKAQRLEEERYVNDNQAGEQTTPQNDQHDALQGMDSGEQNHVADERNMVPPDAPSNEFEEQDDEPIPDEEETLAEDADDGEEAMSLPVSKRLENAKQDLRELRILDHKRREAVKLQADYTYWRGEAQTARQKAELAKDAHEDALTRTETAKLQYEQTHFMGFRRGINFKLGPLHIVTPGIEKAIRAEAEKSKAEYSEAVKAANFRDANVHANYAGQKVFELEQKVAGIERSIDLHERINGQLQDFDNAEVFLNEMVKDDLEGLTPGQVLDAYENDELSAAEAKEILEHMGHSELIELLEAPAPSIRH